MFTFKSSKGLAASDVIRSMKRLGFADDEIYDALTGVGLPGEQVQLLIEKVSAEFEEAKLESRTSRLASEVQRIFEDSFTETKSETFGKINALSDELQLIRSEIAKLSNRIVDLQSIIDRTNFFISSKSRGKLTNRLRRC
jgi:ABC-type phosphate transport system auxiliary subunit